MDASVPAVKSAFHRGRTRLHELAREPGDAPPPALSPGERTLLAAGSHVARIRDFLYASYALDGATITIMKAGV
jgi:RNA polymerase sigma-70 factor (ECF subfamily)